LYPFFPSLSISFAFFVGILIFICIVHHRLLLLRVA
jgi:hypothetical protein